MEYLFNNLDPVSFQRLINAILVARFGESIRLTPLRGADRGKDSETAPGHPYFRFEAKATGRRSPLGQITQGRYLFQTKHHRTTDARISDVRKAVVQDFEDELTRNVLSLTGEDKVNYFFLITNVPASGDAIASIDHKRNELLKGQSQLHADVWWGERTTAFLDQLPSIWPTFPDLFAGRRVPLLAEIAKQKPEGLPRAVRMAIERQFKRDSLIKFRQIELENSLTKLFVDLDVRIYQLPSADLHELLQTDASRRRANVDFGEVHEQAYQEEFWHVSFSHPGLRTLSAIGVLTSETTSATKKIILEGGPGQGKSTITQMLAQIYRDIALGEYKLESEGRWDLPKKVRLPFRIELRSFGEWLAKNPDASVEQYLTFVLKQESGGSIVDVNEIHSLVEGSPVLLIFDGLDEVGSDDLRDEVLKKIAECVERFETSLRSDLRVIVTTRPPAIAGRREQLPDFRRFTIAPLTPLGTKNFVKRWLAVQLADPSERQWVRESFEKRQNELYVKALATNPMQLSVLLHFIRLKGEAFPDRRVELYTEYFKTVIDRDIEKSPELQENRATIEVLHQLLGYKIHAMTEAKKADGTLSRPQLLQIVEHWLTSQGKESPNADRLFKIGEERLGLIVAMRGEGEEAVYGFEIQPIREYFAAAFISEQIEGDAHSVFENLLRRAYWREVALFLAGLRRDNEKADLVSRCRTIDADEHLGWRQDGRNLVLQLLQEGVFSQPPHVFIEAVDYVTDLLDFEQLSVQNEPKELLQTLSLLIRQAGAREVDRVDALATESNRSHDAYGIYRLHRVGHDVLASQQMSKHILACNTDERLMANIRLRWPLMWGFSLDSVIKDESYWTGISDEIWASTLWNVSTVINQARIPLTPSRLHSLLVEQFAMSAQSLLDGPGWEATHESTSSNLAIWKLAALQRAFLDALGPRSPNRDPKDYVPQILELGDEFRGIDNSIRHAVTDLIESTAQVLHSIVVKASGVRDSVRGHVATIAQYIEEPGITGWLASRCVTNLFEVRLMALNRRRRGHGTTHETFMEHLISLQKQRDWQNVLRSTGELFGFGETDDGSTSVTRLLQHRLNSDRINHLSPTHVRTDKTEKPAAVTNLLVAKIRKNQALPFEWLSRLPLFPSMIRPLLASCSDCMAELLEELGKREFVPIGTGDPLFVQQTRSVLKAVKNTDNASVLRGATFVLFRSRFLKMADTDSILKLIRADQTDGELTASFLNPRRVSLYQDQDAAAIEQIATAVLGAGDAFPLRATTTAARYLSEHRATTQEPLEHDEENLRIYFQGSQE